MLAVKQKQSNTFNLKDHRKRRFRLPGHKKSTQQTQQINPASEDNENARQKLTQQKRQQLEHELFSQLQRYANKPRIWQIAHSSHIKKRLLDRSSSIANDHGLTHTHTREFILEFFDKIDETVLKIRHYIQLTSIDLTQKYLKLKTQNNQWYALQIQRAQQIFPDWNEETSTKEELLDKYRVHIFQTLTPKSDPDSSNCTAQLREQPFDLDLAYEQSEQIGREYLDQVLDSHRQNPIPNVDLIEKMVNLGLQDMKVRPTADDFENAINFLSKISILHKCKHAYANGLRNMGDDFMLLRFGKAFGPNASPTTSQVNNQFIYLVHLFLKSISQFAFLMKVDDVSSPLLTILSSQFSDQIDSLIKKYPDNHDELFSPKTNVDQWTWLIEKWRDALRTFPILLTNVGAFPRLVRTTIGIGITRIFHFAERIVNENQFIDMTIISEQIFQALQMGFYFGIAYAIVDCIQDEIHNVKDYSDLITEQRSTPVELLDKWLLIMEDLLSGKEYDRNQLPKTPLTPLLLETFDSLVTLTKTIDMTCLTFNELALLLRSQRVDKKVPEEVYPDEEIFLGAVLKSHFTYTCTTYLGNVRSARDESERLWLMPFLGQLTDDCRDFHDDITSNSVTSFTQYALFCNSQEATDKQLSNPFYVFLNLCADIYENSYQDPQTGAFLGRRIARTLKSIEVSNGDSALRQFLHIFCQDNSDLRDYIQFNLRDQFSYVTDPEKTFFRHIHKASVSYARTNRKLETYVGDHLNQIENALKIHSFRKSSEETNDRDEQLLISAMNYSVTAGGKRLRPLMMLMVADQYQLSVKNILPLACGIEYLHTSSLIFDDLPAQDNSDLRRGRPTLHKAIINNDIPMNLCEGRAQLAAVDLIAVSMNVINNDLIRNGFSPERVNQIVGEISFSMHDLCIGQIMDLRAAHMGAEEGNQLEELDRIAWLKTGKAIEIVLITPAILHGVQAVELTRIRELARLMGILFQMRDDLLDIEGENIGKPAELDQKNHTVTYVSILGVDKVRQRLKQLRQDTLNLVDQCWPTGAGTLEDVVNYIVHRKN